ncbi:unnamed protein product [Heterobilharzia americana]|nr:unnamed protein product [Heterobilharzia americana]
MIFPKRVISEYQEETELVSRRIHYWSKKTLHTCKLQEMKMEKISLRRWAIPRLPVTPSRRAIAQSNRNQILDSLYCSTPESTPGILNSSGVDHQHTCNNDSVLSHLQPCNNSSLMTEIFSQSTEIKIQSPV